MVTGMSFAEPLPKVFSSSKLLVLDFTQIPKDAAPVENIQQFFEDCKRRGINPRLPENRQKFNDRLLTRSGKRYLVSRYGEDRSAMLKDSPIAKEDRVLHLGIDIFCKDQEPVLAPCDGEIVRVGYEKRPQSYGHYLIIKQDSSEDLYLFFGHLSKELPAIGKVKAGDKIARLGDFKNNENGGWSRHLHLQMMTDLPPEGETPIGYSTKADIIANSKKFPDPKQYFGDFL